MRRKTGTASGQGMGRAAGPPRPRRRVRGGEPLLEQEVQVAGSASCAGPVRNSARQRSIEPCTHPAAASRQPEERPNGDVEEAAAGVARDAAEEVGPEHGRQQRAVAARRLALDATVLGRRERAVAFVHPRQELVTEVGVVAARRRGVDELRAADARPRVREGHHALGRERVDELRVVRPKRSAVAPHVELAREALDDVDGRVAPVALGVVARRRPHPERSLVRVAERVAAQRLALEPVLVETSQEGPLPGLVNA